MKHRTCIFRENMPNIPGDEWIYGYYKEETRCRGKIPEGGDRYKVYERKIESKAEVFDAQFEKNLLLNLEYILIEDGSEHTSVSVKIVYPDTASNPGISHVSWAEAERFLLEHLHKTRGT